MKIEQDTFKIPLRPLYSQRNVSMDRDLDYLIKAYQHTEELWWDNFLSMKEVKYVLLAEAPQYGKDKSYIYNPQIPGTPFLGLATINQISLRLGLDGRLKEKPEMLQRMRELGLLVLDLFPYAFNDQTQFQYQRIMRPFGKALCKDSSGWHLKPKCLEIKKKSNRQILFGVRYSRLFSFASEMIEYSYPDGKEIIFEKGYKVKNNGIEEKPVANAPLDTEKISDSLKMIQ